MENAAQQLPAETFHVEVNTYSCEPDAWTGNGVKHQTSGAACQAAVKLKDRWTAVKMWRVVDQDGKVIVDTNNPETVST